MTAAVQAADASPTLRLTTLVAAARTAAVQGRSELATSVREVIAQAAQEAADRQAVVREFVELARGGMSEAVLPFTADPLTIDYAALIYPSNSHQAPLRLYSTSSVTDLGHMLCTHAVQDYVDHAGLGTTASHRPGGKPRRVDPVKEAPIDLPDQAVPDDWVQALIRIDSAGAQAQFAPGTGDTLRLMLAPGEASRWAALRTRPRLMLLKVDAAGRLARRDLGTVPVKGQGGIGHTLIVGLSGSQQIELHAAFFDGWWMLIGEGELRALAPVPDLDPQASPSPCHTDLPMCGLSGLAGHQHWLTVPAALASRLVTTYGWVAPADSSTWLQMLTTKQKGPR